MTTDDQVAFAAWLVAELTGETVAIGAAPDSPDRCVTLRPYEGPETPNWRADYRAQLICRGRRPGPGVSPHQDVNQLTDLVVNAVAPAQDQRVVVPLAGGLRAIVRRLGSGRNSLGPDTNGRERLSINIALDVSRVP